MIRSMTGFASGETETGQGTLAWELRSVNHRFLELHCKLPDGLRALEPQLRELAGHKLKRGKVDAALQFRPSSAVSSRISINEELAAQVIGGAETLARDIASPAPVNPLDVMRWPGVVAEDRIDLSMLFEPAAALFDTTLDALVDHREREGARLQALLEERLGQIAALATDVQGRLPDVLDGIRERVRERARELEVKVDPERMEQELVMLAQKLDVAEELDRLHAHVAETRAAFRMEGAVGRRLDFLMQEFNREANTLGSKSADADTTKAAVDLKVLIEQLREQVQNVE